MTDAEQLTELAALRALAGRLNERIADLEAIVIELGGVGALPIDGEESATTRTIRRLEATLEKARTYELDRIRT